MAAVTSLKACLIRAPKVLWSGSARSDTPYACLSHVTVTWRTFSSSVTYCWKRVTSFTWASLFTITTTSCRGYCDNKQNIVGKECYILETEWNFLQNENNSVYFKKKLNHISYIYILHCYRFPKINVFYHAFLLLWGGVVQVQMSQWK